MRVFGLCHQDGVTYVNGQPATIAPGGDYYTLDSLDLAEFLLDAKASGQNWIVYLSGSSPAMAECPDRKIRLRSLHRLESWDRLGRPSDPAERSKGALTQAESMLDAQDMLGLKLGCGLSAAVKKLAPGLRNIRRNSSLNIQARADLIRGGRCEVFRTAASEPVRSWDMRSAYGGAYKGGIPGGIIGRQKKLPRHDFYAARVTVDIPEYERVPMMPHRAKDGSLLFPWGKWEGWVMGPECYHLAMAGHVKEVHEVDVYERVDPYSEMLAKLHAFRMSTKCAVAKAYAKLVIVSAYGVLASHSLYPIWYVRPHTPPTQAEPIRPGVLEAFQAPRDSMAHGPAAAWILSSIRAKVGAVLSHHEDACYSAIDAVVLPAHCELPTGTEPGDWQAGKIMQGGRFYAQGTYSLGGGAITRASGIEGHVSGDYLTGSEVSVTRTAQAAGALRAGSVARKVVKLRMRKDVYQGRKAIVGDPEFRTVAIKCPEDK